jgi:hypothetical protein
MNPRLKFLHRGHADHRSVRVDVVDKARRGSSNLDRGISDGSALCGDDGAADETRRA